MEKALITGICGFIGSTVALKLIERGVDVIGIDMVEKPRNKIVAKLIDDGKIKVFKGDFREFDYSVIPDVDYVYSIAGKVSPWGDVAEFDKVNVNGTKRAIDFAKKCGAKSFLYLSSVAVYGFHGYCNLKEEDEKKPFTNPYSLSKLHAETMVMSYCKEIGLPFVVVRPCNVFGPYDYTSSYQIYSLIKKGNMPYIDHGKYISCFVYVENLADAIADAGLNPNAWNEDYNISDARGETLHEYFTLVANAMGVKPKFMSLPSWLSKATAGFVEGVWKFLKIKKAPLITKFSTYQNCVDYHFSIDKARTKFGFEPKVGLADGVKKTVDWFNASTSI